MNQIILAVQNTLHSIGNASRTMKITLKVCLDGLITFLSLVSAILLHIETPGFLSQSDFVIGSALILFLTIFAFAIIGFYRAFTRYLSSETITLIVAGSGISAIVLFLVKLALLKFIPWPVLIIYFSLLVVGLSGSRFLLRAVFRIGTLGQRKNLAVYGAGKAGIQILQSLKTSPEYRVRIVIDDNLQLQGKQIFGVRIMGFDEAARYFERFNIDTVLLAISNASFSERQKIITQISNNTLQVKAIPAVDKMIDGSAKINDFEEVAIEELLGRDSIDALPDLLGKNIIDKTVLVTGAGGSIGSELCSQIVQLKPKKLLVLDLSELSIYTILEELETIANDLGVDLVPLIGSVQDRAFIADIMFNHKIDTIFHAAAYKHVPLMEKNVAQAFKNNTLGTLVVAEEAVQANVSNFTLISTDKAVNPTNVMGASKRLAERICQMISLNQTKTRFSMVRFGNVLGSSGSVVPLFKKQIAAGGPVTLTHQDVTRYFMTISEAVQLVIQASSLAKGGEVFVLDMGKPVKIKDLAFKMIQLAGLRPNMEGDFSKELGAISVRVTGLRPGEKMFEELSYGDNLIGTVHPRIMIVVEEITSSQETQEAISQLKNIIESERYADLIQIMSDFADYTSEALPAIFLQKTTSAQSDTKIVSLPVVAPSKSRDQLN